MLAQVRVGEQRDVVVPVPGDVAQLPGIGQAAHVVGRFQQRHAIAPLRQAQGQRQAQQAAADDAEMFARTSCSIVTSRIAGATASGAIGSLDLRWPLNLVTPARTPGMSTATCIAASDSSAHFSQRLAAAADAADRPRPDCRSPGENRAPTASRPSPCRPSQSGRSSGRSR